MRLNKKLLSRVSLIIFSSLMFALPVFASDPGVKANTWLQTNLGALIPGLILVSALFFLVTRDWMKLLSFVGIILVIAMILNWTEMKNLANTLWKAIFG
ncbi:hypothetical protein Q0V21_31355 [Paenibacillus sp. 11B]|uniref:hypothetical protein n=1 Tax=unclassified Paenibacillus TaxID=185978 RepID=UPI000CF9D8DC|nr:MULTISPECIES: hypothetical protein [unclassified Paenibacillus]MDN8593230.1 hypothetical protein [Paenibacillus sp. 11B]PQP80349.1 hypothetical protein C0Q44_28465 [Paenibacillus sp. PCH8]